MWWWWVGEEDIRPAELAANSVCKYSKLPPTSPPQVTDRYQNRVLVRCVGGGVGSNRSDPIHSLPDGWGSFPQRHTHRFHKDTRAHPRPRTHTHTHTHTPALTLTHTNLPWADAVRSEAMESPATKEGLARTPSVRGLSREKPLLRLLHTGGAATRDPTISPTLTFCSSGLRDM